MLSSLFPRDNNLWITGKITDWEYDNNPPQFFDNSKYFYLYLHIMTNAEVYWITNSSSEYDLLKYYNLPVIKYGSFRSLWLILRAKFSFHHYGINQINPILQAGTTQIDFWHGTPLKKIRYDVVPKNCKKPNVLYRFLNRRGVEYVASTSKFLSEEILKRAFDVNESQMLNMGYPRTDVLNLSKEELIGFCKTFSKELMPYIDTAERFDKVFLYMPTWRDYDPNYFIKAEINYNKLNEALKSKNACLFLKLHPLTKISNVESFSNIIQINNDVDMYPFLPFTDFLITDYSSIYFDYLLLDKEIIFIPYDIEEYLCGRELYFDYNEVTPGKKYKSFSEFIDALDEVNNLNYSMERKYVKDLFIEDYDFCACKRIYEFFASK